MRFNKIFYLGLLLGAAATEGQAGAPSTEAELLPDTIKQLDINRYTGTWFEIASTQPDEQAGCVCTTATYTLRASNLLGVENSCRILRPDGEKIEAYGRAIIPDPTEPGKLSVRFGDEEMSGTNYWIVELAPDYQYAVISTAQGKPIWILARNAEMDPELYSGILVSLEERGFDTGSIQETLQEGCWEAKN